MPNDFTRTEAALADYDAFNASIDAKVDTILDETSDPDEASARVLAVFDELDQKAAAVGHAFGLDTASINALDTCEACIRPGPWVRKLVSDWRATTS